MQSLFLGLKTAGPERFAIIRRKALGICASHAGDDALDRAFDGLATAIRSLSERL